MKRRKVKHELEDAPRIAALYLHKTNGAWPTAEQLHEFLCDNGVITMAAGIEALNSYYNELINGLKSDAVRMAKD